jgi:HEAT repeat protein
MRSRQMVWILAISAVALVAVALALLAPRRRDTEPVYNGRRLSEWANDFCRLRKRLDPASPVLHALRLGWILDNEKESRAGDAETAFEALGPISEPAITDLTRMLDSSNPHEIADRAASSLHNGGKNAFPPLLRVLEDPRLRVRWAAMIGVRDLAPVIGTNGLLAVPALVRNLDHTNSALAAAAALGALALEPRTVVPALVNTALSTNNDDWSRREAILALSKFSRDAGPAVPTLIHCLDDGNWIVASVAALALGGLRLEPQTVVPALTAAATNPHFRIRQGAALALGQFGRDARPSLAIVRSLLTDYQPDVRRGATIALLQIAPETMDRPALLNLLNDPSPEVRTLATNALLQVAPQTLHRTIDR